MTEQEEKAWEELVELVGIEGLRHTPVEGDMEDAILAADADAAKGGKG